MRTAAVIASLLFSVFLFGQRSFDLNEKANQREFKIASCISDSSLIDCDTLVLDRYTRPFGLDETRINKCGDSVSISFPCIVFEKIRFSFIYKGEKVIITYFDPEVKDSISVDTWMYYGFSGKYSYLNDSILILTPEAGRAKHTSYYFLIKEKGDSVLFINLPGGIIEKKED